MPLNSTYKDISNSLGKCKRAPKSRTETATKVAHSWSVMLTGPFAMYCNRQIAGRTSVIAIVVDLAGRSLLQEVCRTGQCSPGRRAILKITVLHLCYKVRNSAAVTRKPAL